MKHLKKSILVLGTVLLVSLFSTSLFAKEEKVTVYNNLDYPIIAVFRAVGYIGTICGSYIIKEGVYNYGNCTRQAEKEIYVAANSSATGTFGAGTSGRHVYIKLPSESMTIDLLTSYSGTSAGENSALEMWNLYFENTSLLLLTTDFDVQTGIEPLYYGHVEGHGCDHKFNVVGHSSGTLTVNDIYFTLEMTDDGHTSYIDAHCDCEKTED
jgi:hypothetical protein